MPGMRCRLTARSGPLLAAGMAVQQDAVGGVPRESMGHLSRVIYYQVY